MSVTPPAFQSTQLVPAPSAGRHQIPNDQVDHLLLGQNLVSGRLIMGDMGHTTLVHNKETVPDERNDVQDMNSIQVGVLDEDPNHYMELHNQGRVGSPNDMVHQQAKLVLEAEAQNHSQHYHCQEHQEWKVEEHSWCSTPYRSKH